MDRVRELQLVVHKYSVENQPTDFAFWQSRPLLERLAALEAIRREHHGPDYELKSGFQRVCRIVRR